MLNNRDDDKFEGNEESEYHFSDEDVSYEVEPEASKTPSTEGKSGAKVGNLVRSKRIWIVGAVFLGLVFLIYKMILPSSTPSLEIAATPASVPPSLTTTVTTTNSAARNLPQNMAPAAPAIPAVAPVEAVASNLPPSGAALQKGIPAPNTAEPAANLNQAGTQAAAQPVIVNAPAVIPVNSAAPAMQTPSTIPVTETTGSTFSVPGAQAADATAQNMEVASGKALAQLQADYTQKINDFSAQNKVLQDQLQSLNARVAGLEAQLNQVLQALSRQNQSMSDNISNTAAPVAAPPTVREQSPAPKIAFNVQAIIPGRAWLKSDNGDTMTVAEGDVIKGVGRVSKIDPYDGIVEINTGNKTVTLSYGNPS